MKEGKYPEQIEYDNYNTWNNDVDNATLPQGFNREFNSEYINQKMKEIAKKNGYKDIINNNFVYINPEKEITIGSGMDKKTIDTSKISMQELIILFKNKIVKEMVNVFRNILSSNLLKKVDNTELKNIVCDEIIHSIDRIEQIYKTLEEFLTEEAKTIGNNNVIMNQILGINGAIRSDNINNLIKLSDILKLQKQGKSIREINKELNINVEKFLSHARRK